MIAGIRQFPSTGLFHDLWCRNMWYAFYGTAEHARYYRDDGKVFSYMQKELLNSDGGTYFLTQEEAQTVLDRFSVERKNGKSNLIGQLLEQEANHAAQDTDDESNTKEITNQAHILQEQE